MPHNRNIGDDIEVAWLMYKLHAVYYCSLAVHKHERDLQWEVYDGRNKFEPQICGSQFFGGNTNTIMTHLCLVKKDKEEAMRKLLKQVGGSGEIEGKPSKSCCLYAWRQFHLQGLIDRQQWLNGVNAALKALHGSGDHGIGFPHLTLHERDELLGMQEWQNFPAIKQYLEASLITQGYTE
jgi:hypothetical protein